MSLGGTPLSLRVVRVDDRLPGVRSVVFEAARGARLPAFVPGSHLVLDCGGRFNAYSLTSPGHASSSLAISVLRCDDGNGGSAWVHEALAPGRLVQASLPRSHFAPVASARRHLFIAGGIGITPFISHVRAAVRWHRSFELIHGVRDLPAAPHRGELQALAGDRARVVQGRDALMATVDKALVAQPIGTHLYVCGPGPMIDAVEARARAAGWPGERVHSERFGAGPYTPGAAFDLHLARTGRDVPVPAEVSMLEALAAAGVTVPSMCRHGVCGECRVGVRAGRVLHRDLYLSDDERAAGDSVMCCVSRGAGWLELDL